MAAGDQVKVGTAYQIEFSDGTNALSYTGYTPTASTVEGTSDLTEIKDERNATVMKLYSNPGERHSYTFNILSTGSITPPDPGTIISLTPAGSSTSVKYCVESASVGQSSGVSTLSMTLVREDSMAATYDA